MIAWCRHITEADLHFFQQRAEEDVVIPGAGKWEHMTDLRLDSLTYTAWRRRLPVSLHHTSAPPPFSMCVTSTMHQFGNLSSGVRTDATHVAAGWQDRVQEHYCCR